MEILLNFEGSNIHGTGAAHITKEGKFKVEKAPCSLSDMLKSDYKDKFLAHMPHNGWTIAHLRLKTHGPMTPENTHPFVVNDWCLVHNGIFSDQKHYRHIITKFKNQEGNTNPRKLLGECDSEVATQLVDIYGPEEFTQEIDTSGVFVGLHRSGSLYVMKTSGELTSFERSNKTVVLASDLNGMERYSKKKQTINNGCWEYGPDGKYVQGKEKKWAYQQQGNYNQGHHSTRNNGVSCGASCATPTAPMSAEERAIFDAYGYD